MIDDTELPKLLRFISGESPADEADEIRARLERDPALRAEVEAWRRVRDARPPAWDTEGALVAMQQELRFGERRPAVRVVAFPDRTAPPKRRVVRYATRIAAALLVGAGIAMVWHAGRVPRSAGVAAPVAYHEYTTPRGQRAAVHLPDGTEVVLAAETRLRVPRDFGGRGMRREVRLEGQAYFRVVHDETRPFVVRTATSVTEDIGTAFTVRAYPMEPEVEVVLAEGAVAVRPARAMPASSAPRVLAPGQLARLDTAGHVRTEAGVDVARRLAWTTGSLVFDGVPFRRAAADVERWYDLDIRLADSALGTQRVSGTIDVESVDAVLGYLALALGARYERHGQTVTFFPRRPGP